MPACFQLYKKTDPTTACVFQRIDEEMCAALGVPCDEKKYYLNWYNSIGFRLATGRSFEEIRTECVTEYPEDVESLAVINWLDENYTLNAYYTRHKD